MAQINIKNLNYIQSATTLKPHLVAEALQDIQNQVASQQQLAATQAQLDDALTRIAALEAKA